MSEKGSFGQFGGSYVPEDLGKVLGLLDEQFERYKEDPEFIEEFKYYVNYPPLTTLAGCLKWGLLG